ncbi:hypothetical protein SDC9_99610 [bioreactor metagenome]|uniref:Uncharacterized protein n=1 Tax=bioreactor metagenome TaxID=1076179 RepID=A0A645AIT3_9ZZZZ
MLSKIGNACIGILAVQQIKNGINLALHDLAVVVSDITDEIADVAVGRLLVTRNHKHQLLFRAGYSDIQKIGVVRKIRYYIIDGGQNNGTFLTPLELMYCMNFNLGVAQFLFNLGNLISVWSNNTDFVWGCTAQLRQDLLHGHINLPLIDMITTMVAHVRLKNFQDIRLSMIIGHDNQLVLIEFLIAEADDFGVAAVVLSQERLWDIGHYAADGFEKTIVGKGIPCGQIKRGKDSIAAPFHLVGYDIGQLF